MAPGATGIRPWRHARFPRCARSSVPEESAPETFLADSLRRQCRESGSHPGCSAGSATSSPATHTTLFGKPSYGPAPDYPYVRDRHYRKCKRTTKALNFAAWARPVISASYRWKRRLEAGRLCKGLHFWAGGHPVTDAALRFGAASAQAQNLDRDVIRAPAFAGQFDQLVARLFRGFVFHGVKNLRVSYQSPQSVTADQENVLRAQRLRLPG